MFPFNSNGWFRLIESKPQSQHSELYQSALAKSPKSFVLWTAYLAHLKANEPATLPQELRRAVEEVGLHVLSSSIYEMHLEVVPDPFEKKLELYLKALARPIAV